MNELTDKPTTRKVQAEERRHQILESALEVFAEKGFSRTTVKDLADAAGMSGGLMYHYFSSKEQLLEEAMQQESFLPHLKDILEGTSHIPCPEVLKNTAGGFLQLLKERKQIIDVFLREGYTNENVHRIWTGLVRNGVTLLSNYLNRRIESGEMRPHTTEITARCLFSSVLMFYFTRDILSIPHIPEKQFIEELVDNLLEGLKTRRNTA